MSESNNKNSDIATRNKVQNDHQQTKNQKRNRNSRFSDSPPQSSSKKLKEKPDSPLASTDNEEQVTDPDKSQVSNSMSYDPDNTKETMEEVFDRMLRESEKRTLRNFREEIRETVKDEVDQLREDLKPVLEMADRIMDVEGKLTRVMSQIEWREKESRKCNIIVHGLTDKENESYRDRELAINKLAMMLKVKNIDFSEARRFGKYTHAKPRPMMIQMVRFRDKADLQSRWKSLVGTGVSISDDLTIDERKAKSILVKKKKEIQMQDRSAKCTIRNGNLQVWRGDTKTDFNVNTTSWTAEQRSASQSSRQRSSQRISMDQ
jgi:hypothetical protein